VSYLAFDQAIRNGAASETVSMCRDLLTEVAEGRCDLVAIRHPLGFLCLPLSRDHDHGVCVHHWDPDAPRTAPTTSPVHAHSWDLLSFVLHGRVGNTSVRVTENGVGGGWRVFEVHSRDGIDQMVATARLVDWEPQEESVVYAGQSYVLPAGRFHASVVEDGTHAVTVVLGRTRAEIPDLSLGPRDTRSHRVPRQRCGTGETARIARTILTTLAGAAPTGPGDSTKPGGSNKPGCSAKTGDSVESGSLLGPGGGPHVPGGRVVQCDQPTSI